MKIRTMFVTNSSSSSYICLDLNESITLSILKQNGFNSVESFVKHYYKTYDCNLIKGDLDYIINEGSIVYFGMSLSGQLYDKSINEKKQELLSQIKKHYEIKDLTEKDIYFDYGSYYC